LIEAKPQTHNDCRTYKNVEEDPIQYLTNFTLKSQLNYRVSVLNT